MHFPEFFLVFLDSRILTFLNPGIGEAVHLDGGRNGIPPEGIKRGEGRGGAKRVIDGYGGGRSGRWGPMGIRLSRHPAQSLDAESLSVVDGHDQLLLQQALVHVVGKHQLVEAGVGDGEVQWAPVASRDGQHELAHPLFRAPGTAKIRDQRVREGTKKGTSNGIRSVPEIKNSSFFFCSVRIS